ARQHPRLQLPRFVTVWLRGHRALDRRQRAAIVIRIAALPLLAHEGDRQRAKRVGIARVRRHRSLRSRHPAIDAWGECAGFFTTEITRWRGYPRHGGG